jgi:hypothetical protein
MILNFHLFCLKVFCGKFSYSYQSKIQNSFSRIRNCNYLNPCSKLTALNHYLAGIHKQQKKVKSFSSDDQLNFGNFVFGQSFRSIRKKIRKFHCYDIEKYNSYRWQRLGMKERILNFGLTRIFHFIDGEFFFGELFFKDNQQIDIKTIRNTLISKYIYENRDDFDGDFQIQFTDGIIYFEDTGINLSIKYVYNQNETINQKLHEITEAKYFTNKTQQGELHNLF